MIDLQLLGGLAIESPDLSTNSATRRRHPLAVLALVATAAPQAIGRDKLMAFLWPESASERANNSLRQTLFRLRRDLGEDLFLPESAGTIQLNPAELKVDLWKYREALARHAPADAVAVYGGQFLDGFHIPGLADFTQWIDGERDGLEREHVEAIDALAQVAEEEGRHDDAVSWRRREAAADPYSSRVALALLKALTNAGDRPGALEYASVHENIVRQHLDADPDPAVTAFVTSLREAPSTVEPRTQPQAERPRPEEPDPIPTAIPGTPAPTSEPPARPAAVTSVSESGGRRMVPRLSRIIAAAVLAAIGIVGAQLMLGDRTGGTPTASLADRSVVVLGTGVTHIDGRDVLNRLVSCEGPACPATSLPQDAYVVPKHSAYGAPIVGTSFIAPVQNGTTALTPGYACCTTATFENEFSLPSNTFSARISLSMLADNQAVITVNGVEFGRHTDRDSESNYLGPSPTFSITFAPDPSGTNRLRATLWNGGGAVALWYHAVVTYEVADAAGTSGR